jgi:hypothetical protein
MHAHDGLMRMVVVALNAVSRGRSLKGELEKE